MKNVLKKAFTLIELLIVIVIIGILATALIPKIQGAQDRARYARVRLDMENFRKAFVMAQTTSQKTLYQMANVHQREQCPLVNLRLIAEDHPCRTYWYTMLRAVELHAGMDSGSLSSIEKDPWGSPYVVDTNEMAGWGCTGYDTMHTVGPDGMAHGLSGINALADTADNIGINLMQSVCSKAY